MHLDTAQHTVTFDQPGMQLDAGGIAKGYAADEALAVLKRLGIHSALVAASGDLAFSDAPPGQPGWKVGVDSFDKTDAPFTRVLMLSNRAVSTSGDTEQHLDANGVRYSHIINPKDGVGLTKGITVTVVARHGIDADGTTKVVSLLGPIRGLEFIDSHPELAALVVAREHGQPKMFQSSRFGKLPTAPVPATARGAQ
jgi:thiamine biosynthesis lipoprotein